MAEPQSFGCLYCDGMRSPCICTEDCGARPGPIPETCHHCPRDECGYRAWLISTGFYPELEEDAARSTATLPNRPTEG